MAKCNNCERERTPEDTLDYSPLQVVFGQPLGWYSGDDAELCPGCLTKIVRGE